MPANAHVMTAMDALLEAQRAELATTERLLQLTNDLQRAIKSKDATDEELNKAIEAHVSALDEAQSASEATQATRFRLQEYTLLQTWSIGELETSLRAQIPAHQHSRLELWLADFRSVTGDQFRLLQELQSLSAATEDALNRELGSVGKEARAISQGRQATQAYALAGGGAAARFIDKRE